MVRATGCMDGAIETINLAADSGATRADIIIHSSCPSQETCPPLLRDRGDLFNVIVPVRFSSFETTQQSDLLIISQSWLLCLRHHFNCHSFPFKRELLRALSLPLYTHQWLTGVPRFERTSYTTNPSSDHESPRHDSPRRISNIP